jgi:NAD(P) transhydrogenase subunit alpha
MAATIAESDVVITTAAVPGKKAPMLIRADVVRRMKAGSLIIDMAAERGGNCELSKPDEVVVENGVTILGPTNMAATIPYHASQMFAKNVANLLALVIKEGKLVLDMKDEIIAGTLETDGGDIIHKMAREIFALPPLAAEPAPGPQPVTERSSQ